MTGGPEDFDPSPPERRHTPDQTKHKAAAAALRAAAHRAPLEVETADLTVAGGDVVQILCLAELLDWLHGLAIRVENGEPM